MSAMTPEVLVVPGYMNSGPAHWQSLWEARHGYRRVHQRDWEHPQRADWVDAIDQAVRAARGPVVLVAHSLGCIAAVHWAAAAASAERSRLAGAFLVAPSDVERWDMTQEIRSFAPIPLDRLPCPSIVVASTDDLYSEIERPRQWAAAWGSRLVTLEDAGHINADAGFGPWVEGEALLAELIGAASGAGKAYTSPGG
jgi:hypothetical protein